MKPTSCVTAFVAAAALSLAACGGGGGDGKGSGSRPITNVDNVRDLTGLSAPAEKPAAQRARSPSILSRADSLIKSTVHGETSHPDLPTFRIRSQCSGTQCSMSEPRLGFYDTVSISDFEFVHGSTVAIGTKHGITLMSETAQHMGSDLSSFGAWMEHGAFTVQTESTTQEGTRINSRYGLAGGDLTGTRPRGTATWLGLMVGTPATGSSRGDRLLGDATLSYDLGDSTLDATFSSITNIDRGAAHSTRTVRFQDIPVGSRGTFEAGLTGNRIQGGFYGPGHAEVAGIFEQSNIVGAFGATRQ